MTRRTVLRALLASALVLPLALTACSPRPPVSSPDGEVETSAAPAPEEAPLPDLTFDAGRDLPAGWTVQWADGMVTDDDYAVASADDGNGNWSYTYLPAGCRVRFWQGSVANLGSTAADRELSDLVLAAYIGEDPGAVAAGAVDDAVVYGLGGPEDAGVMAVRSVSWLDPASGASSYVSARGFAALDGGLVVGVECPAGTDAAGVAGRIQSDMAALLVPA